MTSNESNEACDPISHSTDQEEVAFKVVVKGQQNSGRWSSAEHEAFLRGMAMFGKSWRKVASTVGTRTIMQTRTHAQKHFETKGNGSAKSLSRAKIAAKGGSTPLKKRKIKIPRSRGPKPTMDEQEQLKEEDKQDAVVNTNYTSTPHSEVCRSVTAPMIQRVPFQTPSAMLLSVIPPLAFSPNIGFRSTLGHPLSVTLRDNDILFPIQAESATRPADIEYMELLKINSFIFQVLPRADQQWLCRNLVHFLTAVRGRRWILCSSSSHSNASTSDYSNTAMGGVRFTLLRNPVKLVEEELRTDAVKIASLQSCPFWLMGEFDPEQTHKFVYRDVFGNWKKLKKAGIRAVLQNEGLKNLLLLPPSVRFVGDTGVGSETSNIGTEPE